jgi:hypothetical protein
MLCLGSDPTRQSLLDPYHIGVHITRALIPPLPVLFETLQDQPPEIDRDRGIQLQRIARRLELVLHRHRERRIRLKWHAPRQHLVEDHAERTEI